MNKEKVIDKIADYVVDYPRFEETAHEVAGLIFDLFEVCQPKWISVEDGLPEEDGRYLIMIFNKHQPEQGTWMECEEWYGEKWTRIYHATVTHWQHLPDTPAETACTGD